MPNINGTTINGLNSVSAVTANDEIPVWDVEASPGEPTKKITAQNMTASIKTLGSLVNATEMNNALAGKQNTLTFDTTPTTGSTNPVTSGGVASAIAQSTATTDVGSYFTFLETPTAKRIYKSGNVISVFLTMPAATRAAGAFKILNAFPSGYVPVCDVYGVLYRSDNTAIVGRTWGNPNQLYYYLNANDTHALDLYFVYLTI